VCHNQRAKPHWKKKPGDGKMDTEDGEGGATSEEDAENYVDEEDGDKTKVYSSISLQESSRLNRSVRSGSNSELLLLVVAYCIILLAFRR
jgi:hypothetical protein